ncbi:putative leucine-rich repeat-containing, plant-type, leucine-rich repeat domain superfamily [Helianthus annuus]|nr:putative leucine-rich repeat-containing, plant-type, leucine-rich repeat domain superfamily [Helianthus annuus]
MGTRRLCFQSFFLISFYLILIGLDSMLVSGQCQINQRSILIQLKNKLQFDSSLSTKLVSWNPNATDCCAWGGVTCSSSGQVIGLDLSNETIYVGVDNSNVLFNLKNLESLNLAANNFNFSQIPSRFGSFASLKYLNLSNSLFSGQIPGELSQLKMLEVLDLSSLFPYGTRSLRLENPSLAMLVQNLTRLRGLYLDTVNLSTQNSNWCQSLSSSLPDLEVLSLSECQLSGPLDESLEKLQSLSVIRLAINNLSAPVPDFFADLKNLTILNLGSCNLLGTFPSKVLQLKKLQILDLALNENLSGYLPDFPVNGSLKSLVLSHTNFSGGIPESIGNLRNLSKIDLWNNNFRGRIPESIQNLTQLEYIDLSSNNFTEQIPSFQICKNLAHVDLSRNGLSEIPRSIFELQKLSILLLSLNNLSGTIRTEDFQDRLTTLDLSFNNFSIKTSDNTTLVNRLPKFSTLKLASCNLVKFPNLKNQSRLVTLDLSNNKIEGKIPTWIWEVGNGSLSQMNLSHNRLTSLEEPYNFPYLYALDLHSNHLSGVIPIPPQSATIIDYSNNLFNSSIPESIGKILSYAYFFSVSNNMLTGIIPASICNATFLKVLDMSNNQLNGSIPKCLIELGSNLGVLNLGNNSLSGRIEGTFPSNCALNTLDLHENHLEGNIPESLVNCSMLEVLNLGKNLINDTYPCSLSKNTNLRVLVLRSNKLHGPVVCGQNQHYKWSKLQILDMAHNSFSGTMPADFFRQWGAMMTDENGQTKKHISFPVLMLSELYYQDSVILTVKGLELELVKILELFTSIDISSNHFSGEIPSTIGQLKALYLLNISHNEFTGSIPPSIRNLSHLESLDMSSNRITGDIPSVLTSLPFLSSFNLSYNHLEGKIPTGNQFNTFDESSYIGNKRLCGFPLSRDCTNSTVPVANYAKESQESDNKIDWQSVLYGFGFGAAISVMFSVWKGYSSGASRQSNLSRRSLWS